MPRWKVDAVAQKRKEKEKGDDKKKKSLFDKDPDDGPVVGVLRGGAKTRDARAILLPSDVKGPMANKLGELTVRFNHADSELFPDGQSTSGTAQLYTQLSDTCFVIITAANNFVKHEFDEEEKRWVA